MLSLTALFILSTPRIEAFLAECPRPTASFTAARGPTVKAMGPGVVREAHEGRVVVAHCFYENHEVREVLVEIQPLTRIDVAPGASVEPGQVLGVGPRAVTLVDGQPVAAFAAQRQRVWVAGQLPVLLIVDVDGHRAVRLRYGQPTHVWEVGHGQAEGVKEVRGDLKTPRGLYDVVAKSLGPFGGDYAEYYGGVWIKLNYPNAFDAARGLDAGLLGPASAAAITQAWRRRGLTPQGTKLGGGIGFHGWASEWTGDAGFGKSWGCLVLHLSDVREVYDNLPLGAAVLLL